jgi:tripartite-type tricarboxylate transporter receptor subunit TctC
MRGNVATTAACAVALIGLASGLASGLAQAQSSAQPAAEFYAGKTVQFMVGYPPSGGFDAYTRVAARFMGKHIPGNPNVIVVNMPGASSLTFVRYLQVRAPKDGTQFGMFNRGLMPKSVLDPKEVGGIDFTKFTWIGSMNSEMAVCYTWGAKGIRNMDDLRKTKFTLGDTSKNSGGYIYTSIVRSLSNDMGKMVLGYATTGDIWLAIERGEVDGNCTVLTSIQTQRPEWLSANKINMLVQFAEKRHKDLPNVPTIFELVTSENERRAINFLIASEEIGRPVMGPPGMERADVLRKAFLDTMKDPEFLAFADKMKMDIDPLSGERAAEIAAAIQNTPKDAVELARQLMD